MELDDAVAVVVRELRKGLGLTQREMGFRCGLDPMTVSRIERAERLPSLVTLLQIAKVCDISGEEIVRLIEARQPQIIVAEDPGSPYNRLPGRKGKKR